MLATAHAVTEGLVRGVSGELTRKSAPQTYTAFGRNPAPPAKVSADRGQSPTVASGSGAGAGAHRISLDPVRPREIDVTAATGAAVEDIDRMALDS